MTKTEFREQFKRLRVAGYRLPVFEGVTIEDVLTEWFRTFSSCSVEEFSQAIDKLKQTKTDTFWPATGELWTHIFFIRKERRIRRQAADTGYDWSMSDADRDAFLTMLRETMRKIAAKHTMPHAEPQVEPQHVQDALDRADEESAS